MSLRVLARAFLAVALLTSVLAVVAAQPASAAASYIVDNNTVDDKGTPGTLRWAIEEKAGDDDRFEDVDIDLRTSVTLDCAGGGDLDYFRGNTITIRNYTGAPLTITQTCPGERIIDFFPGNIVIEGGTGGIIFTGGNVSGPNGKGGAISIDPGTASLTDTLVRGNNVRVTGLAQGGALFAKGNVTLLRAWFDGNITQADSGDFALGGAVKSNGEVIATDSQFTGNTASSIAADDQEAEGGAIFAVGKVTLQGVSMTTNRALTSHADAANGGAVYSEATVEVVDSVVAGNSATATGPGDFASARGGGVYGRAGVTVLRSEISGNTATSTNGTAVGGAIAAQGPVVATNSTISENTTSGPTEQGGGIWTQGEVEVDLTFTTVIQNTASSGANVFSNLLNGWASLIAAPRDGSNCELEDGSGTDYFWVDDLSCELDGADDIENNGGALPVAGGFPASNGSANGTGNHLPDVASPTSDEIINTAACDGITEDQRAVVRPQGDMCDRGSVELKGLTAVNDLAHTITAFLGDPVTTAVLANDNLGESGPVTVTIVTQPTLGIATVNPDNTTTYIPVPLLTTVQVYEYEVCGAVNCATATVRVTVNGPPAPEIPEQPETPTSPETGPTTAPRPPTQKPVAPAGTAPAGKTTAPKYTG